MNADSGPAPDAGLGPEWEMRSDGRWHRAAARVVVFDADCRVLLMRGHGTAPGDVWWITVGGGIGPGESARQGAVRELYEETGLRVDAAELEGPVLVRATEFDFLATPIHQDEQFFVARLTDPGPVTSAYWTDIERAFVDELRWWSLDELTRTGETLYPRELPALARWLADGWDGRVQDLGTSHD